MEYQKHINNAVKQALALKNVGEVAGYIPELAKANPGSFGVCLTTIEGEEFVFGDSDQRFSIQSIAKVFSLTMAYELLADRLWKRVGVEPSGTAFNSLIQLEVERGIPRNPLINAGAIVVCDVLLSELDNAEEELLNFIRKVSGLKSLNFNSTIAESERLTGYRNRALVNLMKDFGNIKNDTKRVLDLYFKLCSIEMTCRELSGTFLYLANRGLDPKTGERIISISRSKRINAIMQLCGFYDEAGDFAFKVGLPGKSGVGGGIAAVLPGNFSISVWSPKLNAKGNSFAGMNFLEFFTTEIGFSVY